MRRKKVLQPDSTLCRPLRIFLVFWLNVIRIKLGKKYIKGELAKQEAVLYSLILFPTFFFWYLVVKSIFC